MFLRQIHYFECVLLCSSGNIISSARDTHEFFLKPALWLLWISEWRVCFLWRVIFWLHHTPLHLVVGITERRSFITDWLLHHSRAVHQSHRLRFPRPPCCCVMATQWASPALETTVRWIMHCGLLAAATLSWLRKKWRKFRRRARQRLRFLLKKFSTWTINTQALILLCQIFKIREVDGCW